VREKHRRFVAITAFKAAAAQPEMDANRVGLCGPSRAGSVVPLAAEPLGERVDFMCVVSAAVMTPAEQYIYTARTHFEQSGFTPAQVEELYDALRSS